MDFALTEEQRQLEDTVRRFVGRDYGFEHRRAIQKTAEGWSRETWAQLADLGALAVNVPEEQGGLGYGPVETMLVMQAFGAGLLLEPYLASAVIATTLLRETGAADELLPALASGEKIAVLAHFEPHSRWDEAAVAATAHRYGDGWVIRGRKGVVPHGGAADLLIVSARTGGEAGPVGLFAVPRETPGLALAGYPTLDGHRAAELQLPGIYVPDTARLGGEACALPAVGRALDAGLAALCAEAVGVLEALLAATAEYLKTRKQFGQPIGRFQALQHRMADMLLHVEQARSMAMLAALRCADPDEAARRKALSAAKVTVGQACRFVGQQAVQLHGGMGMTDELNVSHWFKRLTAIELSFGDTDTHLQRFAALSAR
ncbi:MAG: acyl-CoA dehydrogenase family protein [Rhodocyclaceae bacterium]|nr:acyl-CoA dehydrogenase family protein [Rhodocyclaceae bacterium]